MPLRKEHRGAVIPVLVSLMISGCVNNAQKLPLPVKSVAAGATIGAGVGAAVGAVGGNVLAGVLAGGAVGSMVGMFNQTPPVIIHELKKQDVQYVQYGDTHVLNIPTDRYFEFNTHRFSDQCMIGMMNIVRLLRFYPCSTFYVAGFTDEIGSRHHKNKLSQSRADAIVTFLWAHDIPAQHLRAEGYGDKFTIGDNHLIHGSAYNRRIEIEWVNLGNCKKPPMRMPMDSK